MKRRARNAFAGALVVSTAVAVAACGGGGSSSSSGSAASSGSTSLSGQSATFVIFDIGQKNDYAAWTSPAEKSTGLKITYDAPTDYSKLQAQVESENVSWTVVQGDPWWAQAHCGTLAAKVEVTVPGASRFKPGPCAVPGDTFAFLMTYDASKFASAPPTAWKDFFDLKKYPGKRAVWGSYAINGVLEGALLADGVQPENLYPLDLKRAFAKLDTIKSDIVFYDTQGQAVQMMQSHQVTMAAVTNGQGATQAAGGTFEPVWNQSLLSWDAYLVPKGANMAAANAILKQIASAKGQESVVEKLPLGVTNPAAKPKLTEAQSKWSPSGTIQGKSNETGQIQFDQSYYAKHEQEIAQAWTNWVSG